MITPNVLLAIVGDGLTIALNILLAVVAAVLLLGVVSERDKDKNRNITIAFVAVVALIIALNTVM